MATRPYANKYALGEAPRPTWIALSKEMEEYLLASRFCLIETSALGFLSLFVIRTIWDRSCTLAAWVSVPLDVLLQPRQSGMTNKWYILWKPPHTTNTLGHPEHDRVEVGYSPVRTIANVFAIVELLQIVFAIVQLLHPCVLPGVFAPKKQTQP